MKYLLPIGIFLGVLAVTLPPILAIQFNGALADPASLGLFGTGLLALGMARRQQDKTSNPN